MTATKINMRSNENGSSAALSQNPPQTLSLTKKKNTAVVGTKTLIVLDTSVLIYDENAMYAFKDYDILLPYTLISELVNLVSSKNEVSRAARAARRVIYEIINSKNEGVRNGSFTQYSLGKGKGNLLIGDMNAFTLPKGMSANDVYSHKENDHVFIDICQKISFLQKSENLSKRYQADRAIALLYKEIRLVTNDQVCLLRRNL